MPDVTIAPAAREDLTEIAAYTFDNWGSSKRNAYMSGVAALVSRLAEGHIRGRRRDDLRKGLLSVVHGKHVMFYREIPGGIEILRILHQSQDHTRHI